MLKNRAFHVSLVKTPQATPASGDSTGFHYPSREQVMDTVKIIGAAYTLKVVLDTAREIAVLTAKAKIR